MRTNFLLLIFLLLSIQGILNAQVYPDNIKEIDCFTTDNEESPWGIRLAQSSIVPAHQYYTPLCGDLNGDGIQEIVVTQSNWVGHNIGRLVVFDGSDASQSAVIELNTDMSYYAGAPYGIVRIPDESSPSDTIGLIVVRTVLGLRAYRFNSLTDIILHAEYVGSVPSGTIGFTDFNNDGKVEVYIGNWVFDAYTLTKIGNGNSNSGLGYFHNFKERVSYASDVLPTVAGTELICGSVIYSVDVAGNAVNVVKTITPPAGCLSEGNTEVADFDGDGLLDVLVKQYSSSFRIYAYDPRTGMDLFSQLITNFSTTEQNYPLIGDIDADGKPEIVLLTEDVLKAYKYDGISVLNELWTEPVFDPSGSTGLTLFDFNQDGIKEIVYRDERDLRIINGSKKSHFTGADTIVYNLAIYPVVSNTVAEYPIVVDCDNDGEAEIVTTGTVTGGLGNRLHIFKSINEGTWAPARSVWNQYAYNVTNVNKDLTIPSTLFNNATIFPNGQQPFNNFQEQATTLDLNGDMVFELIPDSVFVTDTICEGVLFLLNGDTLKTSGRYIDATFCDSVVVLDLMVKPVRDTLIVESICADESYVFGGDILTASGVYKDTLVSSLVCDSIVSLELTVNVIKDTLIIDTICSNSTYDFNGTLLSVTGEYKDTLLTSVGCDSIVTLDLEVKPLESLLLLDSICTGNYYDFYGQILTEAGLYIDTIASKIVGNCDTIVHLTLAVLDTAQISSSVTVCEGFSYFFEGDVITETGVYTRMYKNVYGCDSSITLIFNVINSDTTFIYKEMKEGEFYQFNNQEIFSGGEYSAVYKNVLGCDSIVILNLVLQSEQEIDIPTIFSPNNDGVNDRFVIKNSHLYPDNKILIFNRWGNKVYEASPYFNNWDGYNQFGITIGGNQLPVGTYFYLFNLGDGSKVKKGYVYLNR